MSREGSSRNLDTSRTSAKLISGSAAAAAAAIKTTRKRRTRAPVMYEKHTTERERVIVESWPPSFYRNVKY